MLAAEAIVDAASMRTIERARVYDFASFRIATRPVPDVEPGALLDDEHDLQDVLRAVVRVELRERLEAAWPERSFDPDTPDMIVEVRPRDGGAGAWLFPQAAFVAGRYRKLSRELSQTVFHCRPCRGRGLRRGSPCPECGGAGRRVPECVEEFVCPAIQAALDGRDTSFHGSGREDVDVLMLGDGRPFVVTVESPTRRRLDPDDVARRVAAASDGRVEVRDLRIVDRETKRAVTTEHGLKTYRVVVTPVGGARLPDDATERVAELAGVTLAQRNPARMTRRADIVRRRTVHELTVTESGPEQLVLRVTTDPGLYVKELVSSDDGRTTPSVSSALGVPCVCSELDVIGVRPVGSA